MHKNVNLGHEKVNRITEITQDAQAWNLEHRLEGKCPHISGD